MLALDPSETKSLGSLSASQRTLGEALAQRHQLNRFECMKFIKYFSMTILIFSAVAFFAFDAGWAIALMLCATFLRIGTYFYETFQESQR